MICETDIEKHLGDFTLRASFTAKQGITGLLGASGCGKSLTLKCIAGLERPDKGRIVLDDTVLFDSGHTDLRPQKRHVGYLFQHYALFPNMTVRQNILCGLHHEKDRQAKEKALKEALDFFQLTSLKDHKPHQLSGGQQQRAALARILVSKPRLLLLDEPFSALDAHLRLRLQIEMRDILHSLDIPAIMVTHDRDEAYHMCDHIAIMENGFLVSPRPAKALFADPASECACILTGCKNHARARKVSEYELEAIDWGIRLQTAVPLRDDLCGVGIRAHYFHSQCRQNRFPVSYIREMEEPFEWVIQFRLPSQDTGSENIWWRLPKDRRPQTLPEYLGIAPANVLPLYPLPERP